MYVCIYIGTEVYTTMQDFYNATGALFAGGRLGGCIVTARLPSALGSH
jgi:hypothetical protein